MEKFKELRKRNKLHACFHTFAFEKNLLQSQNINTLVNANRFPTWHLDNRLNHLACRSISVFFAGFLNVPK
jgi:hypothetical protein